MSRVAALFGEATEDPVSELESRNEFDEEAKEKALKARIENKRRDDGIRRREFNYLRSLRKNPAVERMGGDKMPARPSVFQHSSSFGAEDRASTLEKIDEIEAEIVHGWAKSKAESSILKVPSAAKPAPPVAIPVPAPAPAADDDLDLDFTDLLGSPDESQIRSWHTPLDPTASPSGPTDAIRGFESETVEEVALSPIDSALQDAAIRFAEGDGESSAAVLQDLYRMDDLQVADADRIAGALFDLYRSTGQKDPFEQLAMDYAQRFGRSPAEWFSLPDLLALSRPVAQTAALASEQSKGWISPATLDSAAITTLRAAFPEHSAEWSVDWSPLQSIDDEAATALASLFQFWIEHPVTIHWNGSDALLQAVAAHTPKDAKSSSPLWWELRLDLHCLLILAEAHDELALDYCVIYEVSPPAWKTAQCTLVLVNDSPHSSYATQGPVSVLPSENSTWGTQDALCLLQGDVIGDAPPAMRELHALTISHGNIKIRCDLLGRLDFAAAGEVLNWTVARAELGNYIEFEGVSHLIAILLRMIGLDKFAKISVRTH